MTAEKWSSFATELSRLAEDILRAIEHRVEDNQELVVGALYARANQSFLGSLQLAEAGLTDDASTLIRSMVGARSLFARQLAMRVSSDA